MFGDTMMESKLEAIMAIAALLQVHNSIYYILIKPGGLLLNYYFIHKFFTFKGPFEVGNAIIGKDGVMEVLLALANSGNATHTVLYGTSILLLLTL